MPGEIQLAQRYMFSFVGSAQGGPSATTVRCKQLWKNECVASSMQIAVLSIDDPSACCACLY